MKLFLTPLSKQKRKNVLSFWAMDDDGLSAMGGAVEDLFWEDLKQNFTMRIYPMKNQDGEEKLISIGKCDCIENVIADDLGKKVFYSASPIICRMKNNAPLINFAGPKLQAYQVTVSEKHSMSIIGLKGLFLSSGHCVQTTSDSPAVKSKKKKADIDDILSDIVKSEQADKIGRITLYWVVPPGKAKMERRK